MANKTKKPTLSDIYKERSKLLDTEVHKHIKNSERCGNTLDEKHFDTYLRDMVDKQMQNVSGIKDDDWNVVANTLYNHAASDLKDDYQSSMKLHPRTTNNKMPIDVDKDWEKKASDQLKTVRGGIRDRAKEILVQTKESGRTPSQEQYLNYLKGQLAEVTADMPADYADYVKAYTGKWIETTARDLYDASLKASPRKITNDFPWTQKSRTDQHNPSSIRNVSPNLQYSQPMSEYGDTYRSFSGHDMVCTIDMPLPNGGNIAKVIGALQTVTYSIHDEKTPIRCIGDMNAKGYVFGPRTIAGTLIFSVFDKHWAHKIMEDYLKNKKVTAHFLADELPPFNMTISCANEYGYNARLAIYGITLVNEGQVMSINDVYTENTYQFFALDVDYLTDVVSHASNISNSNSQSLSDPAKAKSGSVIYIDDAPTEEGKQHAKDMNNIGKSTDPDAPGTHDQDYYVGTPKEIMYSEIQESKNNTDDDILARYNKKEISEAEFWRLRKKNQENYQKRMEAAKAYYETIPTKGDEKK